MFGDANCLHTFCFFESSALRADSEILNTKYCFIFFFLIS